MAWALYILCNGEAQGCCPTLILQSRQRGGDMQNRRENAAAALVGACKAERTAAGACPMHQTNSAGRASHLLVVVLCCWMIALRQYSSVISITGVKESLTDDKWVSSSCAAWLEAAAGLPSAEQADVSACCGAVSVQCCKMSRYVGKTAHCS